MNKMLVSRVWRRLVSLAGAGFGALALLLAALASPAAATAETNLLANPGFEAGFYHPDGVPELAVPNSWSLYYLDGEPFAGIAEGYMAYRPETVVWYIKNAPPAERGLFFLDGSYTLKIFKPWAPLYAALSQDVSGLQPGAEYEWVANVFVDVIDHYNSQGQKISPDNEPEGVGLRLGVSPWDATWGDAEEIAYTPWWTAGNTRPFHQTYLALHQPFIATASHMTVWVEVVSKFGYVNNGFFMDGFSLRMVRPPAATATPTSAATLATPAAPSGSPTPVQLWVLPAASATPAPTATALTPAAGSGASGPIWYTIQPGDTLNQIAQRYGVTAEQLASLNGISNSWRIYAGQVIQIPAGPGQPAAPPAQAAGAGQRTYVVQPGDSLYRIALSYGLTSAQLAAANGLADPRRIYPGQVLIIP